MEKDSPGAAGREEGGPSATVRERELTERLLWLCRLRWLAAAGIVGLSLGGAYVLRFPLPVDLLVVVGSAVALYNAVLHFWTRAEIGAEGTIQVRLGTVLAHLQIDLDLVALALVIHLTGGVESPLGAYLVFHMIIASTLLSPRAAVFQATVASGLYVAVVGLEYLGRLEHFPLGFARPDFYQSWHAGLTTLVLVSVLYGSIYLATSIVERLRLRDRELSSLTRQVQHEMRRTQEAYVQVQAAQQMQLHYMRRVSHELRRPVAAAASLLKAVLEGLPDPGPDPRLRPTLQRVVSRLQQGLDLVADLLLLSQAREAPLSEQSAWVDLGRLVEEVCDEHAERAAQREVGLEVEMEPGLAPIWVQPEGLGTVLRNLVGNALKYTPAGGRVRVAVQQDHEGTRLAVEDTGIGIPQEDQPRVFEEFFRSQEAREVDPDGTGLGLSIVQTIMEVHGGRCEVASGPGEGTTFTCFLPHRYPEVEG